MTEGCTIQLRGAVGRVWQTSSAIRILRRPMGAGAINKLQQAWQCLETGEIEWRDVPVVVGETLMGGKDVI